MGAVGAVGAVDRGRIKRVAGDPTIRAFASRIRSFDHSIIRSFGQWKKGKKGNKLIAMTTRMPSRQEYRVISIVTFDAPVALVA